jgi:DNA mismatch endonuclease (patch repair protein)
MDSLSARQRSWNMSHIRGSDTAPEKKVRSALFRAGLRYRINVAGLPGKPDIVLGAYSVVVFVHGCFWHRHPGCRFAYMPKTHVDFWQAKFDRTVQRDAEVTARLEALGWHCLTIWECETETPERLAELARSIKEGKPDGAPHRLPSGHPAEPTKIPHLLSGSGGG